MKCKLCLQEKPLLSKSHIAPNFMYKELKTSDYSFIEGRLTDLTKKKIQTGLFEANILCKECDNVLLGGLETYASKVLYGGKVKGLIAKVERLPDGAEWVLWDGIDYTKFKLFLLSLIWRFSISSKDFYRFVDLGEHEEMIRKMILGGNAGDALDYPCTIQSYRRHTDLPYQIISQPLMHKGNGGICYTVIMCGLVYTFYISKNLIPDHIAEIAVNKSGQLKVIQIPKDNAVKIVRKYMGLKNPQ